MKTKYVLIRTSKKCYRITTTNRIWFAIAFVGAFIHSKLLPLKNVSYSVFPEGVEE